MTESNSGDNYLEELLKMFNMDKSGARIFIFSDIYSWNDEFKMLAGRGDLVVVQDQSWVFNGYELEATNDQWPSWATLEEYPPQYWGNYLEKINYSPGFLQSFIDQVYDIEPNSVKGLDGVTYWFYVVRYRNYIYHVFIETDIVLDLEEYELSPILPDFIKEQFPRSLALIKN